MINTCKVCGKQFTARQRNHTVCSPECRRINTLQNKSRYIKTEKVKKYSMELHRKRRREYRRNNPYCCKICGLAIDQPFQNRQTMHDECILSEAAEYYSKNQKLNYMHYNRLYSRGYCIEDILDVLNDRE